MLYSPFQREDELLAKSETGRGGKRFLPRGWRHELQSVAIMAENSIGEGTMDKELLFHLVASHHGYSRNTFPLVADPNFLPFKVGDNVSSVPYLDYLCEQSREQFHDLNRRYGYWGLAFLEAILRLADGRGSVDV